MNPIILFRNSGTPEADAEQACAAEHLPLTTNRTDCPTGSLVIGRYSVEPFYAELSQELLKNSSDLINTTSQHNWANNFDYYAILGEDTPKSWTEPEFLASSHPGPFVVKGQTYSRKHEWNRKMFAPDRQRALALGDELKQDNLLRSQKIIFREYIPLRQFKRTENGLPISNEWRIFYLGKTRLCRGYYWSEHTPPDEGLPSEAIELADRAAARIGAAINFFVLDIAQKASGGWIIIELNDAQMCGLAGNSALELYENLARNLPDWVNNSMENLRPESAPAASSATLRNSQSDL